jgi:hypothetical protein
VGKVVLPLVGEQSLGLTHFPCLATLYFTSSFSCFGWGYTSVTSCTQKFDQFTLSLPFSWDFV